MAVAATTLSAAIAAAGTLSCTVRDVVGFATSAETDDLVQIDNEYILVTAGMGTLSWTITRGYAGSTAVSHIDGSVVTRLERKYTDASRLTTMSKAASTEAAYLRDCADQANSWLIAEVGRFYGPSTDTTRTFDVESASNELWIAGGLRSFSVCEIKTVTDAAAWVTVTTDVLARPLSWDRIDGMEADRLVFKDITTLGYSQFYPGYATARVTGVFGPAVPPTALRRIADTVGWELYQSRAAGSTGLVGGEDMMMITRRVLTPADYATILLYRGVGPSLYAMPAF